MISLSHRRSGLPALTRVAARAFARGLALAIVSSAFWGCSSTSSPSSAASSAAPQGETAIPDTLVLQARGSSPDWTLKITESLLSWSGAGVEISTSPRMQNSPLGRLYAATADNHTLEVWYQDRICHLSPGSQPYPNRVQVRLDAGRYIGCGGDPLVLLQGRWQIDDTANIEFDRYGRLHLRTPCSHYVTRFFITDKGLRFEALTGPATGCEAPSLQGDTGRLDALNHVTRFDLDSDGRLLLQSDSQTLLKGRAF